MVTRVVAFFGHTNASTERTVVTSSRSARSAPTKVGNPSAHGAEAARLKHDCDKNLNDTHSANMVEPDRPTPRK